MVSTISRAAHLGIDKKSQTGFFFFFSFFRLWLDWKRLESPSGNRHMKHSRLAESFFGKYPNNFKLKHKIKSQEIVHHNWWIPSPFSDDRDHPVCRSRSIPPIITTFKFRYFYLFRFLSSLTFRNEMRKIEKSDNQITTCLKKKRKRDQLFYLVWFLPWWFVIVIIDTFFFLNLKPAQQFCYCVYWRNQLVSVGLHHHKGEDIPLPPDI